MELTKEQALKALVAMYGNLKATRQMRMSRVEVMRAYTFPHKASLTSPLSPGSNAYANRYDGTGQLAAAEFAANLFTHTTPRDQRWFILTPPAGKPELAQDRAYAEGLAQRADRLHVALAQTNFATEIHAAYEDLADGTCGLDVAKSSGMGPEKGKAFTLSARDMNEYCFLTDSAGRPHTTFSEYRLTAYEAAKRWGMEQLPKALQDALAKMDDAAYVETRPFLNVMRPNEQWDPTSLTDQRYRYENLWIDPAENKLLEKGGMRRLRRVIARFRAGRAMPWGWGPTDMAYAWIRCLDKSSEIVLKYGAMKMDPPSVWPDDGAFWPQDATPGSIIVGRLGATDRGVPSFLEVQGDHRVAEWLFARYEALIMRAFMSDVFAILRDAKQRTAREVATILQKSYDIMVPGLSRLKSELFDPLILICLELLTEQDLGIDGWMLGGRELPEFEYDLEIISPLFLAMRYSELQNLDDAQVLLRPWAEIDPSIWDNWSLDEISHVVQENLGIPNRIRRPSSEVRAIREKRAELLLQREQMEQTQMAADAAQKLTKGVEPNSPMARMMEA